MLRILLFVILLVIPLTSPVHGRMTEMPPDLALPQNQAPQAVGYIDVAPLHVGGSSATIEVSSYFSDPDDDTLTYSVNSPSPSIATASISGSTVTITPVAVGNTSKIIVTATDPGGLSATHDFNVTVQDPPPPSPPNQAPVAEGSISNITLQEGGSSTTINASSYFSDPDDDTLTYSVNSPNPSIVTVSISGSTVTIAPVAVGTTSKIIVTATDPDGLTATQDFNATVEDPPPQNRAPVAEGSISNVTLQTGGSSTTINASSYFSDPDDDTLTYSVNSPNPSIVTVSISGSTVTITQVATGSTGKIIVTATDPGDLTATQDFTATVEDPPPPPPPVNRAPVAEGYIGDVTLNKSGASVTIGVASYFADPDGDTLSYSVNSPNPSIVTVSISGSTVTIAPVSTGSTGKIIVTATDPDGLTATQDFTATVINQPPVAVGTISNVTLYKNGFTRNVPVASKFSDPNGDRLTFSAESSNTGVATVSMLGSRVTITSRVTGTATITVTATDTDSATGTQSFIVTVINRHPQPLGTISKMTFHRNQDARRVDVSGNFNDPDINETLTYSATSSNRSVATVSVVGSRVRVVPGSLGTARVALKATDSEGLFAQHGFDVEVVNRPPETTRIIPPQTLNKNNDERTIGLSDKFADPDGDTISFSASSSSTATVTASVSGNTLTITSKSISGTATVTANATDTYGDSVSQSFTVTVRNRAPQKNGSINSVTLFKNRHTQIVDVSDKFTDPDGDTLRYTASSLNTSVATASVSGSNVTITSDNTGSATINVIARDNDGDTATQTIGVTVVNRAPMAEGQIDNVTLQVGGPSTQIEVSNRFSDPDNDTLEYSVDSQYTLIVQVSISGSRVTVAPVGEGSTGKIVVTATDPGGLTATQDFTVTVDPPPQPPPPPPPCPMVNEDDLLSDLNMVVGGSPVRINVSDNFINIEPGDTFAISLADSTQNAVSLSRTGNVLTITPRNEGHSGNIIVKVIRGDDEATCSASDKFTVTVDPATPPLPPLPCPAARTDISIPNQHFIVGGNPVSFVVSGYFTNVGGNGITYSVFNPNRRVAEVSNNGSTVIVSPVGPGQTGKVIVTVSRADCDPVTQDFNVVVTPPCPAIKASIPDLTLTVGGDSADVELSTYFSNLTGASYTISSSDTTVATASRTGTSLEVSPGTSPGTATVTVTVSKSGCDSVMQGFTVTVRPRCPAITASIPDLTLTVGGDSADVELSTYFSNLSGASYTVSSSATSVATASRTGTSLEVSPGTSAGTATVTVTVSKSGCDSVMQDFTVTVEEPATPCPMVNEDDLLSDLNMVVGGSPVRINVSDHFINIEPGDTFAISLADSTQNAVSLSRTGNVLTIVPRNEGHSGNIIVKAIRGDDEATCSASDKFTVTVTSCPAITASIPDLTLTVGGDSADVELSTFFSNLSGASYTISSSDTSVATASRTGTTLEVSPGTSAGTGTISVTVAKVGCDPVTQTFTVTVGPEPPPCPAITASIPDLTLTVGGDSADVELSTYFSNLSGASYTISSSDTTVATASRTGTSLEVLTGTSAGTARITVTVAKVGCDPVTQTFTVTVGPEPPPCPAITASIPDLTLTVGGDSADVELSTFFSNLSGASYTISSSDTTVATASQSETTLEVSPGTSAGTARITVTVAKVGCDPVTQTFTVTVGLEPPPCPAITASIPDLTLTVGGDSADVELSTYFSSLAGASYTVSSSATSVATASRTGTSLEVSPGTSAGTGTITVTVAKVGCDPVTQTFTVTVGLEPPPCPAITASIPDLTLTVGGDSADVELSTYFSSLAGASYTVSSSATSVATASRTGTSLEVSPGTSAGTGTITVTVAKVGCDPVTQTFTVTVGPEPPPCPAITASIPDLTLTVGGDSADVELSTFFSNLSGASYTISSTDTTVATASRTGTSLEVLTGTSPGTARITVTVDKADCDPVTQTFTVTVGPEPPPCPAITASIPDLTLTVGGDSADVELSTFFSNLSGASYTISSSDTTVATASQSETTLEVLPGTSAGTARITVTVSKSGCDSVMQDFTVTVRPRCPAIKASIPDLALTVGGDSADVELSTFFSNLTGASYTISSSATSVATASRTGTSLEVLTGTSPGTATITVTVAKVGCDPVTQTFTVTVGPEPPPCPAITASIPDLTLTVGGDSADVELSTYFSSLAGASYTVSSSATSVATASRTGTTLEVSPRTSPGTATISVTVAKVGCDPVTQTFTVTVATTCPALIMDRSIPDQTLIVGAGSTEIDLTQFFEHIEVEGISITVTSPDPNVAEVSLDGTTVTIDLVSAGTIDSVDITISRAECDPVALSFMVTVKDPGVYPWSVSDENVYRLAGNVGIGLSNPDQKLVVDGKIKAEEVYLSMIPADYVFEEDYPLMPLEDVAEHIEARGHLPGIAPGAEMKSRGIGISRMQTLLLEKIEELSLHVIGQHDRLRRQGDNIASRQRQLELRKQRIGRLEQRLERLEQ